MRIIKRRKLQEFCELHPPAAEPLRIWLGIARRAHWRSLGHLRQTFPHADEVTVHSGRKAVIFNIKGNRFRMITAVHYVQTMIDPQGGNKVLEGKIFLFFLLTHAEYDKEKWKGKL